jgi:hypothetical protein
MRIKYISFFNDLIIVDSLLSFYNNDGSQWTVKSNAYEKYLNIPQ